MNVAISTRDISIFVLKIKQTSSCGLIKQCNKEIKTEQGAKAHMKTKHKNQPVKRTAPKDTEKNVEESKKKKV